MSRSLESGLKCDSSSVTLSDCAKFFQVFFVQEVVVSAFTHTFIFLSVYFPCKLYCSYWCLYNKLPLCRSDFVSFVLRSVKNSISSTEATLWSCLQASLSNLLNFVILLVNPIPEHREASA